MKGDKSTKVGGRRSAGPAAQQSSMANGMQGKPVTQPGGAGTYHGRIGGSGQLGARVGKRTKTR